MSFRRREPRYESNLAVALEGGSGIARNVSASGIFFETEVPFREGAPIRFTIDFTPDAGGPLTMQCHGRVVRIEARDSSYGVAARIEEVQFTRVKEGGDARA